MTYKADCAASTKAKAIKTNVIKVEDFLFAYDTLGAGMLREALVGSCFIKKFQFTSTLTNIQDHSTSHWLGADLQG